MTWWQAAILGLVQGVTEFLPISSDGHLAIAGFVLGLSDMSLTTVVLVHAGTLLATVLALKPDVTDLAERASQRPPRPENGEARREVLGIIVASVPTAIIGLLLEERVERWAGVPWVVGLCLLVTAGFLLWTRRGGGKAHTLSYGDYAWIGVAQGLAVLPGLSRSGSTIAAALALGLTPSQAYRFSFLLSLPAVAGAVLLKVLSPDAVQAFEPQALVAGVVAFGSGYVALRALRSLVVNGRLWLFALYLVPLAAALFLWSALGNPPQP